MPVTCQELGAGPESRGGEYTEAVQIAPDSPKLAVVMVGLPARGKSYTARRIERYLSWLGYRTGVFNVGEYRRARVGAQMPHSFFDPDNPQGEEARRAVAMAALDDMVDVARATTGRSRSTTPPTARARAARWCARAASTPASRCCSSRSVVTTRTSSRPTSASTKLSSPDYEDTDPDEAVTDFRARIAHYQRVYQPLDDDEGAYLRVTGAGRDVTCEQRRRLPGRRASCSS